MMQSLNQNDNQLQQQQIVLDQSNPTMDQNKMANIVNIQGQQNAPNQMQNATVRNNSFNREIV